jgi:hypothetical protein
MDQPSPPARVAHPQPHPPFDMVDFMHKSSSYDIQKVFAEDDHSLPRHVPSERPGGEARRGILKSTAADVLYADKAGSTKHGSYHPIYGEFTVGYFGLNNQHFVDLLYLYIEKHVVHFCNLCALYLTYS